MKAIFAPVLALIPLGASPVIAQDQAGIPTPETSVQYVGDCIAATGPTGVDLAKIEARGWTSMQLRSGGGRAMPIAGYARNTDMSFLSATTETAKTIECVILNPTNGLPRAVAIRDALNAKLGVQPTGSVTTKMAWVANGHRVELTPMGSAANPSGVKITVTVEKR